jgi:membrane protein YqaA with SNARE-associated domain
VSDVEEVRAAPEAAGATHGERRARGPGRVRRLLVGLLGRLHAWAEAGWAGSAVGTWAVLQASVVPGPADTLLVPLGVADPPRVWRLAAWATAGAVVGGCIAFAIGAFAFDEVGRPLFGLFGVGPGGLAEIERLLARWGWAIVIVSATTPISTKMVCIAAGAFGVPFLPFLAALAAGRAGRFAVVAAIVHFAGERLDAWLRRRLGRGPERLH